MTTLNDLSRPLGLSVTQVSCALNGHSDVSAATRQRVELATNKLNYIDNISDCRLVSGRSGVVGFVERRDPGIARDTILFETATGPSSQFSERAMQFVLHLTPESVEGTARTSSWSMTGAGGGGIDGFVLTSPHRDAVRIRHPQTLGMSFVVHGRGVVDETYPFVDTDTYGRARQLTEHLIAQGHRRIGLIHAEGKFAFAAFRAAGHRDALASSGIAANPRLIRQVRMTEAQGMIATAQIFQSRDHRPTAVICIKILITNDVFSALQAFGFSVPGDVSIVAHDDSVAEAHPESF